VHENDQVMVHPSDSEAWKALDDFDPDFARDARNVRIGLAMVCLCYSIQPSTCSLYEI
jgi:hypothetical protein